MIRRLFVYFTVALTLCFIISCKKDSPSKDNSSTQKDLKNKSEHTSGEDLVIRDDTASVKDSIIKNDHNNVPEDSVISETNNDDENDMSANADNRVYDIAETLPEFPGGVDALNKYINEKISEISNSVSIKKPLRTMISFIVETDGSLSNIHVAKSSGTSELDKKAADIIQNMPDWKPAQNNGTNVRMKYVVPVIFKQTP